MKKNNGGILIFGVCVLALSVFGIIKIKDYYNDRYVESDVVYVKVPEDQSIELEELLDMSGNVADTGKHYKFSGFTESRKEINVEFSIITDSSDDLLKPGDYLRVSVSNTIVLNEKLIPEPEVPESVLALLN